MLLSASGRRVAEARCARGEDRPGASPCDKNEVCHKEIHRVLRGARPGRWGRVTEPRGAAVEMDLQDSALGHEAQVAGDALICLSDGGAAAHREAERTEAAD